MAINLINSSNVYGTLTVSGNVDVSGNVKYTGELQVFSGATDIGQISNSSGALNIQGTSTRDVSLGSDTNPQVVFIEGVDGNVGIGSTSPSSYNSRGQDLVIKKTGSDVGISIVAEESGGTDYSSSVMFADGTGGTAGYRGSIEYDHADDSMAFSTAATEAVHITSAGSVGIGTDNPAALLEIVGSGDAIRVESTNTGNAGAQLDLLHFTTSPLDDDVNAFINMGGYYTGTTSAYATQIKSVWSDVANNRGELQFWVRAGGGGGAFKVLKLQADGDSTFPSGNVIIGSHTTNDNRSLSLRTAAEENTVVEFKEDSANYGFSLNYDGTANAFEIKRHKNSATGSDVIRLNRDDDSVQFNGYGSGSITGTATYNLEVDSGGNIIETATGGGGGGVTGSGTTNTLPKWTGSTALGDSEITDTGSVIQMGTSGDSTLYLDTVNKKVGFRTTTPESAMDVNGTLRARNELNVGPTTEQNFFAAGGSVSSGERYIKAGYYGKAETTPPPDQNFPGQEDANSIRTSASFGPNGKFIEDLIYTVVKIEPNGFLERQGAGSGNPALIINPYGAGTMIVLDHVTVWKTGGSGTFCNSGGTSGSGAFEFCTFENLASSGGNIANVWNMPAAVANRSAAFIYSRPAWVAQGTTQPNQQPNALLNNQGGLSTQANRGVYMRTACENYTGSSPTSATFYCRIAYRVFRRSVDFFSATALTISGSGSGGNGPGGSLTSFTRTTSTAVFNDVCSATGTATAYHDGSGTYPTTGDNVYTGSDGGAFVAGGYYKMPANNSWIRITGNTGEVTAEGSC